ncbi:MAG: aminomethyltransferase beta-barrel domain-containing protein [Vicinamibacterales bacterium]
MRGIHRFTVGQRKGLGLGASPTGTPMYVLALRPAEGQVVVGPKTALERTTLTAAQVNWVMEQPAGDRRVAAQIRHRHQPAPATVRAFDRQRAELVFDRPQVAISPGQAAVFPADDMVVGEGDRVERIGDRVTGMMADNLLSGPSASAPCRAPSS